MKSDQSSKGSDQSSERTAMPAEQQIPGMMFAAFPPQLHENRKSWLARVSIALRWKHRRTRGLFYCEARIATADEWRTLNQRLDALKNAERRHGDETNELRKTYRVAGEGVPVARRADVGLGDEDAPAGDEGRHPHRQA